MKWKFLFANTFAFLCLIAAVAMLLTPNVATANVDTGQTAVVAQNTTAQDIGQNEAIQIEVQNDDAMALAQHQKTTMANTVAQTAPATAEACFTVVA